MAVYFVYRCSYGAPTEKFVFRFEHDTIVAWAKDVWRSFDTRAAAKEYAAQVFSPLVAEPLGSLFSLDTYEPVTRAPRTFAEVKAWIGSCHYCEEEEHGRNYLQYMPDWDDNQRGIYVFDEAFRTKHAAKVAFLLHSDWALPAGASAARAPKLPQTTAVEPAGTGAGRLYVACGYVDCKYNLEDLMPADHIDGLRLPDLAAHVLCATCDTDNWPLPLRRLEVALDELLEKPKGEDAGFLKALRAHPDDRTAWGAYSDWLTDRDLPPAGVHLLDRALRRASACLREKNYKPELDLVRVHEHAATACLHEGCWTDAPQPGISDSDSFVQYYLFDDCWCAAHPELARGALTFASRWDVLT
jgi:uncharacterized protein (TIGR02996 family)